MSELLREIQKRVNTRPDGDWGPLTMHAVSVALSLTPPTVKALQIRIGAVPDGFYGPDTEKAIARALEIEWPVPDPGGTRFPVPYAPAERGWPRDTFPTMEAFYGPHGQVQLERIYPAYQLYYDGKPVRTISVHVKIAHAVHAVLSRVRDEYGESRIRQMGIDIYDGCYNDRPKRGGTTWSTHAYAAALDFDAEHNLLHWNHTKARFAADEYKGWFDAWQAEGFISLGLAHNFDWMHLEATSRR